MCFLEKSLFLTRDRGNVEVENLTLDDVLLDNEGGHYEIVDIYRLPEYKVLKMALVSAGEVDGAAPYSKIYLKPTQYIKLNGKIYKVKDLVDTLKIGEYERYTVLSFYLLNVKKVKGDNDVMTVDREGVTNIDKINEFVNVNGLSLSVYNVTHPLNNRFQKCHSKFKEQL